MYRLKLRIINNTAAELRFGLAPRLFFAAFALLFATAAMYEGRLYWFPALLTVGAVLAAFYQEYWRFDHAADKLETRTGLIVAYRRRAHPLSSVTAVEVSVVLSSAGNTGRSLDQSAVSRVFTRGHCRLVLRLQDGTALLVTVENAKHLARTETLAQSLAHFLQVDYRAAE